MAAWRVGLVAGVAAVAVRVQRVGSNDARPRVGRRVVYQTRDAHGAWDVWDKRVFEQVRVQAGWWVQGRARDGGVRRRQRRRV